MITKYQLRLIKDFEGFYGEVPQIPTNQMQLKQFIVDWEFSWRMMHDAEEVEEFVWIEGTVPLEELEKSFT